MPVIRRFVSQNQEENQILKMDSSSRFVVNNEKQWQFLFGPNSELSNSTPIIKIWAKFDDNTFNNIKIIGYLYDQQNASVTNAGSCVFNIYKVDLPNWTETFLTTLSGSQLSNNYFYVNPTLSTFTGVDFIGGDTLMIEASATRLGVVYRDRVYVNHLGIYDNVTRLRQDVEFLDITKQDE